MGVKKFGVKKFGDTSVLKFCFYLFSKPRYSSLMVPFGWEGGDPPGGVKKLGGRKNGGQKIWGQKIW